MDRTQARTVAAQVLARLAPEADLAMVGLDEDLREALDLDSMDFMNFVIGLSEATGRQIPDADTARLHTLAGLMDYLGAST